MCRVSTSFAIVATPIRRIGGSVPLALAKAGQRVGQIAASLRLGVSYVSKVLSRRQRTGARGLAAPQRGSEPDRESLPS